MARCRRGFITIRQFARFAMNDAGLPDFFRPPVDRSMRVLDRAFFRKILPISAATVFEDRNLSLVRGKVQRAGDLLRVTSIKVIVPDETVPGRKCLLLQPGTVASDPTTWSPAITELVQSELVGLRPYQLELAYKDWTMHNILEAILPDFGEDEKETPAGFALVGHVAHLNLREQYLPYRYLIGQVLLDKNSSVRTVINKIEDVGSTNPYRTFPYEVLAGPDDMDVTLSSCGCEFNFNFAKVYWNSRLHTEHERLVAKFQEGEAVCDVMAGIGPFAVPAGKQRVFVSANDLNPDSKSALSHAISKNKVDRFVTAACQDGRQFIKQATLEIMKIQKLVKIAPSSKLSISSKQSGSGNKVPGQTLTRPRSFQHYVMNLPASAVTFLDAFRGSYAGRSQEFEPGTGSKLPMIHVYCFLEQKETEAEDIQAVCELVSENLGHKICPTGSDTDIHFVRKHLRNEVESDFLGLNVLTRSPFVESKGIAQVVRSNGLVTRSIVPEKS